MFSLVYIGLFDSTWLQYVTHTDWREQAGEETVELFVIWDAITFTWRYCNGIVAEGRWTLRQEINQRVSDLPTTLEQIMFVSCYAICMLRNMLITYNADNTIFIRLIIWQCNNTNISKFRRIMLNWRTKFGVHFVYFERWTHWNANNQSTVVAIPIQVIHVHHQWANTLQPSPPCFPRNIF